MSTSAFFAYASTPSQIGETIERAVSLSKDSRDPLAIKSWRAMDIAGHFIHEEVEEELLSCNVLVADITVLNFNVTYEIGFAIGQSKRVYLVRNRGLNERPPLIREVGIFDTIGYEEYSNGPELRGLLMRFKPDDPIPIAASANQKAPVYLLEAKHKTDWISRIISRVKKARYNFRSFDPNEAPRLSASEAINQVAQSYGVLVPLLSDSEDGAAVHNLRAAFVAGLARGMGRRCTILQRGDGPVPLDVRDFSDTARRLEDINEVVSGFAGLVAEAFQQENFQLDASPSNALQTLDLGASSAENEMRTLQSYYLKTEAFLKSLRGEAHLVVGRKGSGKSAIFLQIRDRERARNPAQNIVLDLKPEGYKLVKFKETVLSHLQEGTLQHTITAFWSYVLLLEICYKILEKDASRHLRDHRLLEPYKRLEAIYNVYHYYSDGDFSERIGLLIEKIESDFQFKVGDRNQVRLTSAQITELLYQHDVRALETEIAGYMRHKGALWLLFDNIDKGWPTTGLQHEDVIIIRCLIDSARKIEREFSKDGVDVKTVVFLRNDVYELLVKETSDRGKEGNVMLDWTDADLLRELVRLRLVASREDDSIPIETIWPTICTPLYRGEDSLQFLIERSLMRPRFLLNLINQCKASAVNLRHSRIEDTDIEKGMVSYSVDVLTDVSYEIEDISPGSGEALYAFIDANVTMSLDEVQQALANYGVAAEKVDAIINLLLWYGFLGVKIDEDNTRFIYDVGYSMKMLSGLLKGRPNAVYVVHPAFSEALAVSRRTTH